MLGNVDRQLMKFLRLIYKIKFYNSKLRQANKCIPIQYPKHVFMLLLSCSYPEHNP